MRAMAQRPAAPEGPLRAGALAAANRLVTSRYVLPWLSRATRAPRRIAMTRRYETALSPVLSTPATCERVALTGELPQNYGAGMSERVVEFPWALGHGVSGRLLDAGSTLNHRYVLDAFLPRVERLDVVTLAPERNLFAERGVSYVLADIRELPLRSGYYDCVTCLSTLEHVGMDNSVYGAAGGRAQNPREQAHRAIAELRRVLRPYGFLLVSVPYGRREDIGWLRQFDRDDLKDLIAAFGPTGTCEITVFAYDRSGWRASDLDDAAGAVYASHLSQPFTADGAEGARAVACVRLQKDGS